MKAIFKWKRSFQMKFATQYIRPSSSQLLSMKQFSFVFDFADSLMAQINNVKDEMKQRSCNDYCLFYQTVTTNNPTLSNQQTTQAPQREFALIQSSRSSVNDAVKLPTLQFAIITQKEEIKIELGLGLRRTNDSIKEMQRRKTVK
ncbi:CLUMA_CG019673, isoform A [Clunio marinus]|uniref:CLUMA_CG019673, isoform A n=1 Tax=Clunio marinus TaxID=568069 RepID=A0A1J1J3C4_9DIPT|nr:CLUMA_CG019673, isoform A [Clunio marinus]